MDRNQAAPSRPKRACVGKFPNEREIQLLLNSDEEDNLFDFDDSGSECSVRILWDENSSDSEDEEEVVEVSVMFLTLLLNPLKLFGKIMQISNNFFLLSKRRQLLVPVPEKEIRMIFLDFFWTSRFLIYWWIKLQNMLNTNFLDLLRIQEVIYHYGNQWL